MREGYDKISVPITSRRILMTKCFSCLSIQPQKQRKKKKKYKEKTKTFNLASYERFYDLYDMHECIVRFMSMSDTPLFILNSICII
jgi:hypothetical protein